tara:strand:+ start:81 stop:389 length:309 start_codon:yes stop_codon:yes gene_type:complete
MEKASAEITEKVDIAASVAASLLPLTTGQKQILVVAILREIESMFSEGELRESLRQAGFIPSVVDQVQHQLDFLGELLPAPKKKALEDFLREFGGGVPDWVK